MLKRRYISSKRDTLKTSMDEWVNLHCVTLLDLVHCDLPLQDLVHSFAVKDTWWTTCTWCRRQRRRRKHRRKPRRMKLAHICWWVLKTVLEVLLEEVLLEDLLDLLEELVEELLDSLEDPLLELHQILDIQIHTSLAHLAPLPLKFLTTLGTLAAFGSS